jgi:tRNA synthetases class I (E and Q), catalytic domain
VENILSDIASLGLRYERLTYTSDYFPQMIDLAERMIKAGTIYADDTPVEQMREVRVGHRLRLPLPTACGTRSRGHQPQPSICHNRIPPPRGVCSCRHTCQRQNWQGIEIFARVGGKCLLFCRLPHGILASSHCERPERSRLGTCCLGRSVYLPPGEGALAPSASHGSATAACVFTPVARRLSVCACRSAWWARSRAAAAAAPRRAWRRSRR